MDILANLGDGFATALSPMNLLFAFLGVLIGTMVGVIPGIGPTTAIALLIPVSFSLDPVTGLILLCGIYYGAMYGGSITSILIRTPGEIGTVMSTIDGYEMTKRGRGGPALATAAIGSFVAGTISTILLMLMAPVLAAVSVAFGSNVYFLLLLLALIMLSNLTGGSRLKAGISTLFGMAVAMIGMDPQAGMPRMTLGVLELNSGIDFAIFAMALFAVPEALANLTRRHTEATPGIGKVKLFMTKEDWRRSTVPWFRGTFLGFFVGLLPGMGTLGSFFSYPLEKRLSRKHKAEFGKGAIEGVAGPEAANNAGVGGGLVPLFTLGIPGSPTLALLFFVFTMYGLQPGPQLMSEQSGLIWAIIASMYIGNVLLLVLNLPLVGAFVQLLKIPDAKLYSGVLAFVALGAYALGFDLFSMGTMFVFGLVGYGMQKYGFPLAPAVVGLVLAPMLESSLRRALQISAGDPATFIDGPLAITLTALIALVILAPLLLPLLRRSGVLARGLNSRRQVATDKLKDPGTDLHVPTGFGYAKEPEAPRPDGQPPAPEGQTAEDDGNELLPASKGLAADNEAPDRKPLD
ncbi:tripartite tricarboxylate transporter permease [Arthrobacter sp. NPDC089319]|uniref:tripartite tricarboxylate transporter permease n=1 Tax=Arthrobacter sp. NPDC089319 TaxID=3155915 RepID=UPI0034131437